MILLNAGAHEVPAGTSLGSLVDGLVETRKGIAVALDRVVQPRATWDEVILAEGVHVEVVTAVAGG